MANILIQIFNLELYMKLKRIIKPLVVGLLLIAIGFNLINCSSSDGPVGPSVDPVNLTFAETTLTVAETAGEQQVAINLSDPAPVSGSVRVTLSGTASYGDDYTTSPAGTSRSFSVAVTEGDRSVSFTFTPTDDEVVEADKNIVFTLSSAEEELNIGSNNTLTVTLSSEDVGNLDDPIELIFSTDNLTVAESDGSQEITINFASVAPVDGMVTVTVGGTATYGGDYTTMPEGTSGSITLNISKDDANASFTLLPINDEDIETDETIMFTLTSEDDKLTVGSANILTVTLTSEDMENPAILGFTNTELSLAETASEQQITIDLSGPAPVNGTVTVTLSGTAAYTGDYTTTPAGTSGSFSVAISEGDESVTFALLPTNDEDIETDETIVFTLISEDDLLTVGSANILTVTLTSEDEMETSMDTEILVIIRDNTMYTVDPSSTNRSLKEEGIITFNGSQITGFTSFAYDRELQKGFGTVGNKIYSINMATGEATVLNDNSTSEEILRTKISGLLIQDDNVVASASSFISFLERESSLLWFDKISGEQTDFLHFQNNPVPGAGDNLSSSGLIYDEDQQHFYVGGTDGDSKKGAYFSVDNTGMVTEMSLSLADLSGFGADFNLSSVSVISFAKDQSGNRYALLLEDSGVFLTTIDFSTGVISYIAEYSNNSGVFGFQAMDSVPRGLFQE